MSAKEFLIDTLIDDDINTFCHEYDTQGCTARIRDMLFEGFGGYKNQDLETLIGVIIERDLIKGSE